MGAIVGREARKEAREIDLADGGLQDAFYPWVQMIQWSCEELKKEAVFRWNLSVIKEGKGFRV
ncbi:hypothetical protein, conserved [Eimeria necatrix]|uniref:Uncharacterized protein n=2 Tax=Eimeria TaxID=5800 RepID=U6MP18_9EIME|nr:hypothetical protein, conserved [Eimeria necatrix]CDJ63410.1 hypothetical protein, conserved [Eimeria necatrix]